MAWRPFPINNLATLWPRSPSLNLARHPDLLLPILEANFYLGTQSGHILAGRDHTSPLAETMQRAGGKSVEACTSKTLNFGTRARADMAFILGLPRRE